MDSGTLPERSCQIRGSLASPTLVVGTEVPSVQEVLLFLVVQPTHFLQLQGLVGTPVERLVGPEWEELRVGRLEELLVLEEPVQSKRDSLEVRGRDQGTGPELNSSRQEKYLRQRHRHNSEY